MDEEIYLEKIALCAYKDEIEVNDEERKLRAIELRRCANSFTYFFGRYVKIVDPPTLDNPGGIIKALFPEHLKKLAVALLTKLQIIIGKARQVFISWFISAYDVWYARFKEGATVMIFSKGETEAIEKLAKCRRVYNQLPDFLKIKVNPDSATEMGFPLMSSYIKAFAATETAGISFTASVLDIDEWLEHPYAEENYLASKPTRDAGGQFIGCFTKNPWKMEGLAMAVFRDALEDKNDFESIFFPYDVRSGRDEKWYEDTKRSIPDMELGKLTPDLYMEANYPRSLEEFLRLPHTVAVFDKKALNAMRDDVRSPINIGDDKELLAQRWGDIDCDICHIYKDYHIGNFYIAGTDVSLGVGKDYNITCIMDVKTGDIVADIMSQYIAPEELALHSVSLLKRYHNPLWWVEHNLWGRTVIKKAVELGYRRLGYRDDKPISWTSFGDAELKRVGFFTDDKSRGDLWGALIPAMNDRQITIYNEQGLSQFYGVIRNANKKGKIEAMGKGHDDYPIAVGICWLKKEDVQTTAWKPQPIETLTFGGKSNKWWKSRR